LILNLDVSRSKKIAFTSDRDGNFEIYVMDSNGKNARRLTSTRATERTAVWSPDGRRIVFSSDGNGPAEIYLMNADGSNVVSLTGTPR
jgi:TolB protein